jgi:hypothetical protein
MKYIIQSRKRDGVLFGYVVIVNHSEFEVETFEEACQLAIQLANKNGL